MRFLLLFFCAALVAQYSHAQNPKQDIIAVNKTLLSLSSYSMQLQYKIFLDNNMTIPFQKRNVILLRSNTNFYVKEDDKMEIIETGDGYRLLMDHQHKLLSALKNEGNSTENMRAEALKMMNAYMDSLLVFCEKIVMVHNSKSTVKYECTLKKNANAGVSLIWLEIDMERMFYKSVTTRYTDPVTIPEKNNESHYITLKIDYAGFNNKPQVSASLFNALNYVALRNNKVCGPSKKYAGYKLLNTQ